MGTYHVSLAEMMSKMETLSSEERTFAASAIPKLSDTEAEEIFNAATFGADGEMRAFAAVFVATAGDASVTERRNALRELVRTAALTEQERGECYRVLGTRTDREIASDVFPRLAMVYEDEDDVARELRTVLLGRPS